MKIIMMASRFPYPLEKGDKLRIYHAIKLLSLKHEIHLIFFSDKAIVEDHLKELSPYVSSFLPLKINLLTKGKLTFVSLFQSTLPFQVAWNYDRSLVPKIKEYVDRIKPDIVFCQLIRMSEYAKHLDYPKVIDYMDAFSESMKKRSRVVGFPAKYFYLKEGIILGEYEQKVKDLFNARSIISLKDKNLLKFSDDEKTFVIPNGVNAAYFNNKSINTTKEFDIGFIGNLSYLPNIHAIEFMHKHIFQQLKDCKFLISGATPVTRIKKLHSNNFVIRGWVDDIRQSYRDIAIFVAPIFAGTGQQNKILEAMAMGIPCITTEAVNDSIGASAGEQIYIANNGSEFVEAIKFLMANEKKSLELGKNGQTFVTNTYTWENHVDKLEKLFETAIYEYNKRRNKI